MGASLPPQRDQRRREQRSRSGLLLNSSVVSFTARIARRPPQVDLSIAYDHVLPFTDVLSGVTGDRVTVIIETAGGFGDVGKRIAPPLQLADLHVGREG